MKISAQELKNHYCHLSDGELLQLYTSRELTELAISILKNELTERGLTKERIQQLMLEQEKHALAFPQHLIENPRFSFKRLSLKKKHMVKLFSLIGVLVMLLGATSVDFPPIFNGYVIQYSTSSCFGGGCAEYHFTDEPISHVTVYGVEECNFWQNKKEVGRYPMTHDDVTRLQKVLTYYRSKQGTTGCINTLIDKIRIMTYKDATKIRDEYFIDQYCQGLEGDVIPLGWLMLDIINQKMPKIH